MSWLEDLAAYIDARKRVAKRTMMDWYNDPALKLEQELALGKERMRDWARDERARNAADIMAISNIKAGVDPEAAWAQLEDSSQQFAESPVFWEGGGLLGAIGSAAPAAKLVKRAKRINKKGHYTGAPPQVNSPAAYSSEVNKYVGRMQEGMPGRYFYTNSSGDIWQRAGANPEVADEFVENLAQLSRSNTVGGNTTMSVKGHIQGRTGTPVWTGRFPARDSPALQQLYDQGPNTFYQGHKRDPFARQLSVEWAPERVGRGVNDLHEAESFGYTTKTLGPTQHAWMDDARDLAIKRSNERQTGGFSDWNTGNAQAANWTANKIRRGEVKPGDAAKDYAYYLPLHEVNATYEPIPGQGTGHLPGLLDAPFAQRREFGRSQYGAWNTAPGGGDVLYTAQGFLPSPTREALGRFRQEAQPANVARPVAGQHVNKASVLDENARPVLKDGKPVTKDMGYYLTDESVNALSATEAFRAYFDMQNSGAWHKIVPVASADQYTGALLKFPKGLTEQQMKEIAPIFESKGMWVMSAPEGVSIGSGDSKILGADFSSLIRKLVKEHKLPVEKPEFGALVSEYIPMHELAPEGGGKVAKGLLGYLERSPSTMRALDEDQFVRNAVAARNVRDVVASEAGAGPVRQDMLLARRIFLKEGIEGIRRAAEKGIIPAFFAAPAGLQLLQEEER